MWGALFARCSQRFRVAWWKDVILQWRVAEGVDPYGIDVSIERGRNSVGDGASFVPFCGFAHCAAGAYHIAKMVANDNVFLSTS